MQAEPLTLGHVREQPPFIEAALAAALPRLPDLIARLRAQPPRHIWVTGCASSLFATMCGASIVQEFARRPVTVMHASEFAAYAPVDAGDWVLIGSRSGETGDVIDAIDAIKQAGATLVGIAGDATSTLATEATVALPFGYGAEVAPATKSFQIEAVLSMLVGLAVARAAGGVSTDRLDAMEAGLLALPGLASQALAAADAPVRALAAQCTEATGMFFIGNGPNYALALEGMLKARECAGVHADGIPANEMRHGYMNAVRGAMPVAFLIGPPGRGHQSVASIARTLGRLPATLIALGREGDWDLRGVADTFVGLPFDVDEFLAPVAYAPAIQLFVVYLGMARGQNVDHPAESEMVGSYREVDGRLVYYIDKFE